MFICSLPHFLRFCLFGPTIRPRFELAKEGSLVRGRRAIAQRVSSLCSAARFSAVLGCRVTVKDQVGILLLLEDEQGDVVDEGKLKIKKSGAEEQNPSWI